MVQLWIEVGYLSRHSQLAFRPYCDHTRHLNKHPYFYQNVYQKVACNCLGHHIAFISTQPARICPVSAFYPESRLSPINLYDVVASANDLLHNA